MRIWKELKDFEGYKISNDGIVQSCWAFHGNGCKKPVTIDNRNRCRVYLRKSENNFIHKFVHVLVLETFVGPRPNNYQCCHYDGNCKNNKVENLRWDTVKGNTDDKFRHGTVLYGNKHPRSKLTNKKVKNILKLYKNGKSILEIAKQYNVTYQNIHYIIKRKTWKHINVKTNNEISRG